MKLEKEDLLMSHKGLENRLAIKEDEQRLGNPNCYNIILPLNGILCAEIFSVHDLTSGASYSGHRCKKR